MTLTYLATILGYATMVWLAGMVAVALLDRIINETRFDWPFAALWPLWLIAIGALLALAPFVPNRQPVPAARRSARGRNA